MGRAVFKISVGFVAGALILLAISLYLSNLYLKDQQRLAETGGLSRAMEKVEWASRLDPFSPAPPSSKAYLELRQGRVEAAREAFQEAVDRDPYNYKNYEALGNLQRQQLGDPEEAVKSYRKALERNPHAATVVSRLGEALLSAGTSTENLEEAKESAGTEPEESSDESADESRQDQRRAFLDSLDLAIADALVVQGSVEEARAYLAQSKAEQAPTVLALLNEDPVSYRESVLDAPIN